MPDFLAVFVHPGTASAFHSEREQRVTLTLSATAINAAPRWLWLEAAVQVFHDAAFEANASEFGFDNPSYRRVSITLAGWPDRRQHRWTIADTPRRGVPTGTPPRFLFCREGVKRLYKLNKRTRPRSTPQNSRHLATSFVQFGRLCAAEQFRTKDAHAKCPRPIR
jgi:hypothetical protein